MNKSLVSTGLLRSVTGQRRSRRNWSSYLDNELDFWHMSVLFVSVAVGVRRVFVSHGGTYTMESRRWFFFLRRPRRWSYSEQHRTTKDAPITRPSTKPKTAETFDRLWYLFIYFVFSPFLSLQRYKALYNHSATNRVTDWRWPGKKSVQPICPWLVGHVSWRNECETVSSMTAHNLISG